MKTIIIVVIVAVLAVAGYFLIKGGYGGSSNSSGNSKSSTQAPAETNSVTISNFAFNPNNIAINAGTPITFTNNDGANHTVTADNGKFDQAVSAGQTATITITEPGTYSYHCRIHPSMKGTITIR